MKVDLGRRIRFFRKRADMSQFNLEIATGLASGVISRIETNQVNPNKETVLAIAKILELNNKEIDYLIGITALPPTNEEIEKAKKEAAEILNQRGKLAYLLDERWRFLMISNTFKKLLRVMPQELEYAIGRTTMQVIVEPDSPVMKRVDKNFQEELLKIYLPQYYSYISYMDDDAIYQGTVNAILRNSGARKIWTELTQKKVRKYTPEEDLVIHFDIFGFKIPLYYSMRALSKHSRFEIVEYHTKNRVLDLIPSLV